MPRKYEYVFVRVRVSGGLFDSFSTDYQRVIEQHGQKGWRFVQAHAPASASVYGYAKWCDLIFERELE